MNPPPPSGGSSTSFPVASTSSISPVSSPSISGLSNQVIQTAVQASKDHGETLDLGRLNLDEVSDEGVELLAGLGTGRPLRRLALSHNSLTSLPSSFIILTRLRYLNLKGNDLREIPAVLGSLQSLEILDLSRNKIRKFPDTPPGRLSSLRVLSLSQNKIRALPKYISTFTELKVFKIDHNPIEWPPPEILERKTITEEGRGDANEKAWVENIRNFLRNSDDDPAAMEERGADRFPGMGEPSQMRPGFLSTTSQNFSEASHAHDQTHHFQSRPSLMGSLNSHNSISSNSSTGTILPTWPTYQSSGSPNAGWASSSTSPIENTMLSRDGGVGTIGSSSSSGGNNNGDNVGGYHRRQASKGSGDFSSVSSSPVFAPSGLSSSSSTHWVPPSSSGFNHSQHVSPSALLPPTYPQRRNTHSPSLSTSSRTSDSTNRTGHSRQTSTATSISITHPTKQPLNSSSFSRPTHSRNCSNASASSSMRGVTPPPGTSLPIPPSFMAASLSSSSSSSVPVMPMSSPSEGTNTSPSSPSYNPPSFSSTPPASGSSMAPSPSSTSLGSSSMATPRPSRTAYSNQRTHLRNGSFSTQSQRLSQLLGPKKSLPDLRLNHALIISERQACVGDGTDSVKSIGGGKTGSEMETGAFGAMATARNGLQRKLSDGTLRKLPEHLNLSSASAGIRAGKGLGSPVTTTSSSMNHPYSGLRRSEDDSPSAVIENSRASYFRRLSTLPASTLPKTIPVSLLVLVDSARGILFALTQIQSSLRQHALAAIDDRFSNVLARVLVPAAEGINNIINALDRFDSMSRRSPIPPARVIRGVIEACWRSVSSFGKVIAVLEIQLQVASSKTVSHNGSHHPGGTFEDLRFTRTLLLMLYGSLAEISAAWKAILPILEEVKPYLQETVGSVAGTVKSEIGASAAISGGSFNGPVGGTGSGSGGGTAGAGATHFRKHKPSVSQSTTRTPISPIPERAESHSPSSSRFESPVLSRSASAQQSFSSLTLSPVSISSPLASTTVVIGPVPSGQVPLRGGKPRRQIAGPIALKDGEEESKLLSVTTSPVSLNHTLPDMNGRSSKSALTLDSPHYPLRSALRSSFSNTNPSTAASSPTISQATLQNTLGDASPQTQVVDVFYNEASSSLIDQSSSTLGTSLDSASTPQAGAKSLPDGSAALFLAEIPKPTFAGQTGGDIGHRNGHAVFRSHSTQSSVSSIGSLGSLSPPLVPPSMMMMAMPSSSSSSFSSSSAYGRDNRPLPYMGGLANKVGDVVDEGLLVMMEQAVELASNVWGLLEEDLDWAVRSASATMNRQSTLITRPPSKRVFELLDLIPVARSHTRQLHQTIVAPSEQDTLYEDASQFFHTVNRVAKVTKLTFEEEQRNFKKGIKLGLGKLTRLSMESVTLLHVLYTKRPSTAMSRFDDHSSHLLSTPPVGPGMRPLALGRARSATTGASLYTGLAQRGPGVPYQHGPSKGQQQQQQVMMMAGRTSRPFNIHRSSGSFGSLVQSAATS
ncbi:FOG: Leucine rich repeat [Phaffia rhodozyma]|uniref:FOG: Leucine rich repeat n=1 Tax=Phaffia rhodozyma TaxID=264483 RepID=A0A0F7SWN8_PHARH|nr:FOG: Leucine rich repeat [Phaffia rhodozyma]